MRYSIVDRTFLFSNIPMSASSTVDGSLFELVLQTTPLLPLRSIHPSTLRSVLGAIVDWLIEQQLPALVWAKLPRGDIWQAELERLQSAPHLAEMVYTLALQQEEREGNSSTGALAPDQDREISAPGAVNETLPLRPVYLPSNSPLRREYFLLIWAAQFQGGILAQSLRTAQSHPLSRSVEAASRVVPGSDETSEKRLLSATYLLDAALVQQLVERISQIVRESVPSAESMVQRWQSRMNSLPQEGLSPGLLERLLVSHIHRQDELWQRNQAYRKLAEKSEALAASNRELTQALDLKDDILKHLGHEFRTPLTTMKTALTLLNSPNLKLPQRQRYIELLGKECDRQTQLIASLMELVQLAAVIDPADLQPVQIQDVVPGVVTTYQQIAEEQGIRIAYMVPEGLPPVVGMTHWLKQIMINLLNNSIKFTPRGGQVWVRVRPQVEVVELEVRDTGVGIPASEIPKIFDHFYRIRQAGDESTGAGLGLTVVQQLIKHCGGSIDVQSRIGEGTSITIQLPVYRPPSGAGPANH
jgi:signal transduction histidine kinase